MAIFALLACGFSLFSFSNSNTASAAVGINHQINFQGKLVNLNGTNVTDGSYSVVFSIYNVASAGSNLWTETQTVTVTNGIFQVNLGSVTTLPASVDFNTDNIYLGIKVGADAEMTPRVQFTSVPQAFNSEKLGGLDKTGFVQNGTVQQAGSNFNISGTGVANLLQATAFDTNSAASLSLGATNATSLTISKTGVTTTIAGALAVTQATTLTGALTANGGLINPGSTLNTSLALTNFATGGAIGTAAATVDTHTTFTVNQTTAGQTLTLPSPTTTTAGREIRISNVGTTSFVIGSSTINTGVTASYFWNGTAWTSTGIDTGVTIVGALDTFTNAANGATISGNTVYLQSASASVPGLVNTTTQTLAGAKTFSGNLTVQTTSNSTSSLQVANATGATVLSVDTTTNQLNSFGNINLSQTSAPAAAPTTADAGPGSLAAATYYYVYSYVTASGETEYSSESTGLAIAASHNITVTIANSPSALVTAKKIYRTTTTGGPYNLVGTIANNTATSFTDSNTSPTTAAKNTNSTALLKVNGAVALNVGNTSNRNTFVGLQAGASNTSGTNNTATGTYALFSNTTGTANTANGLQALYSNTTGNNNTANGVQALYSNNSGNNNTANGTYALQSNTTGNSNTANGTYALYSNTTGIQNTANGSNALNFNTTGYNNTANGYYALQSNTTGYNNTATGPYALQSNTTGFQNTANGSQALYNNTSGNANTATGLQALYSNTTGIQNTANGSNALNFNTTGYNNTANGTYALQSNTTGIQNTANGSYSLQSTTTGSNNTTNGVNALQNLKTLTGTITATATNAGNAQFTTGSTTGLVAGASITISGTTSYNGGRTVLSVDSATTFTITTAFSTADAAGSWTTANTDSNTATGFQAGQGTSNGYTAVGNALYGTNTGLNLQTGANYNTLLGYAAGQNITTGANNIIIGQNVNAASATGSNQLNIGGLIQGDLGASTLTLGGATTISGVITANGGIVNPGSTLNTSLALGNFAAGGTIGTASATVDTHTTFTVNQTTAGQTLTLPSPTTTTAGREIRISNVGTTSFVIGSSTINTGVTASYFWNGTAWTSTGIDTGVTIVGALDTFTNATNGATISGNTVYLQSASSSFGGIVNTGSQTFAGAKSFNTKLSVGVTGTSGVENKLAAFSANGAGAQYPSIELQSNGTSGLKFSQPNAFLDAVIDNSYATGATLQLAVRGATALSIANGGVSTFSALTQAPTFQANTNGQFTYDGGTNSVRLQTVGAETLQLSTAQNFAINLRTNGSTNNAVSIAGDGSATFRNNSNSLTAFQIQNAAGTSNLLIADTTNNRIGIGNAAPTNKLTVNTLTTSNAATLLAQSAISSGSATNIGQIIQGVASQTGDLLQAQNSTGTVLASISASGLLTSVGHVNNGFTLNSTLALTDFATGGSIGTAAATVDIYTSITVNQTTAGQTLTLPSPTTTTAGRILYLSNIGTASFTLLGSPLKSGATATVFWNGSAWTFAGADGASILNQSASVQTANFNIQSNAIGSVTALINGIAGQTANILQVSNTNSGGFYVANDGAVSIRSLSGGAFTVANNAQQGVFFVNTTAGSTGQRVFIKTLESGNGGLGIGGTAGQTADLFQLYDAGGGLLSKFDANGALATYGTNTNHLGLTTPVLTLTTGTAGTAFYYVITATNAAGETIASNAIGTTTNTVTLGWTQVLGATGYKVYRNTTNSFTAGTLLASTITNGTSVSFTDSGAATGGTFPVASVAGTKLALQGWAGQASAIFTVANSAGTNVLSVDSNIVSADVLVVGGGYNNGRFTVRTGNDSIVGTIIQGFSSTQTADLLQLQNSSSAVLSKFDANGGLTIAANTNVLAPVATNGTTATAGINVTGQKGGNTTGTTGQTAGAGASQTFLGGAGGDAPAGSTNGNGGSITLNGGAAGAGAGTAGTRGSVNLQTAGGNVGIGTNAPTATLEVKTLSNAIALQVTNAAGAGILTVDTTTNQLNTFGNINLSQTATPASAPTFNAFVASGALTGSYYYVYSYVTASGETEYSAESAVIAPSAQNVTINIANSPSALVTSKKIYRTTTSGGPYNLVGSVANNTATTFTDSNTSPTTAASDMNKTATLKVNGSTAFNVSAAQGNTLVGVQAGAGNTTGFQNTASGYQALQANTSGYQNTSAGVNALFSNTTGYLNTASGFASLYFNTTGYSNTATGAGALQSNTTGYSNTASGINSLQSNTTGFENAAAGRYSLGNNTSGNQNTAFGRSSLVNNTSGSLNSALGYFAGNQDQTNTTFTTGAALQNATAIGAYAQVQQSNSIVLGSVDNLTKVGIGTTIPLNTLSVSPVDLNSTTNTATQSANTITAAVGTPFTSAMVGEQFIFANGTSAGTITGFTSTTVITVSTSQTVTPAQNFRTHFIGLQVTNAGNAGIGIAAPGFRLDVQDSQAATYVARVKNTNAGTDADGLLIDLGVANASRTATNYFVGFAGAGTVAGKIQGGASAVVYTTTGADYAEHFKVLDTTHLPQPGELVSLDPAQSQSVKSATGTSGRLVGVISTSPGFVGNGPICKVDDTNCDADYAKYNVLVALNGQVPTKVSVVNGAIHIGDPITASSVTGVGTKALSAGTIVGFALEDTTVDGVIKVVIQPQFFDPLSGNNIQSGSQATLAALNVTGNLDARDLNVSGAATISTLTVTGTATINGTLTVSGMTTVADITVNGKIISKGSAPISVVGVAAGTSTAAQPSATVAVDGTDTAGTVTITSGMTITDAGVLAELTFAKGFPAGTNFKVALTPTSGSALDVHVYVEKTATGFKLVSKDKLLAGTSYSFDYIVIGSQQVSVK